MNATSTVTLAPPSGPRRRLRKSSDTGLAPQHPAPPTAAESSATRLRIPTPPRGNELTANQPASTPTVVVRFIDDRDGSLLGLEIKTATASDVLSQLLSALSVESFQVVGLRIRPERSGTLLRLDLTERDGSAVLGLRRGDVQRLALGAVGAFAPVTLPVPEMVPLRHTG